MNQAASNRAFICFSQLLESIPLRKAFIEDDLRSQAVKIINKTQNVSDHASQKKIKKFFSIYFQ